MPGTGWRTVSAVTIGVVAIAAVLWITFKIDPKDQFQQNVAWAVLALGIAGTAAVLPGFVKLAIPKLVTAGGCIAIFVLVYTQSPLGQAVINRVIPPVGNPQNAAEKYIKLIDSEEYVKAYSEGSAWSRDHFSLKLYLKLYKSQREGLGAAIHRELSGTDAIDNPPGFPPGAYRIFLYRTDFAGSADNWWYERVVVGPENRTWKVYSYTIAPAPPLPTMTSGVNASH